MNLLAIDVGNTRLKWTLYDRPAADAQVLAHGVEFLEQLDRLAEGAWAKLPEPDRMLGCIVAGHHAPPSNETLPWSRVKPLRPSGMPG